MKIRRSIVLATATLTLATTAGGAVAVAASGMQYPQAPAGCVLAAPNTYGQVFGLCPGDQYDPPHAYYQLTGYPTSPAPTATTPVTPATVYVTITVTVTKTKTVVKTRPCRHWSCW